MKRKWIWFIACLVGVLGLDQGTKWWARHRLQPTSQAVPWSRRPTVTVIPKVFELRYIENPNGMFSVFRDRPTLGRVFRVVVYPLALICVALLLWWIVSLPAGAHRTTAKFGLLVGGALGNLLDMTFHHAVTDFIVWKLPNPVQVGSWVFHEWPTFNIADAALVVGVLMLILNLPKDRSLVVSTKSTSSSS